jgi:hypothetical protein
MRTLTETDVDHQVGGKLTTTGLYTLILKTYNRQTAEEAATETADARALQATSTDTNPTAYHVTTSTARVVVATMAHATGAAPRRSLPRSTDTCRACQSRPRLSCWSTRCQTR